MAANGASPSCRTGGLDSGGDDRIAFVRFAGGIALNTAAAAGRCAVQP